MRIYLIVLLISFIGQGQIVGKHIVLHQNQYERGLAYFERRSEKITGNYADPTNINQAIFHFKEALSDPTFELKAATYLLRSYDFKGNFTQIEKGEQIAMFEEGMEIGERLLKKYPTNAPLMYWYMSNVGRWGQTVNFWQAVRANIAGKMRELCETLIELNPSYNDAGAYRILGVLNIKIPHIPLFITWPSDDKGLQMLQKATQLAPDAIGNWVFYAEALSKLGSKDKALAILDDVLSSPPRPERLIEDRKIQERARELLNEIQ